MKRTLQEYQRLEKLVGGGLFGAIHKARHVESGEVVALKKMRLEEEEDGVPATMLREIAILRELKHPNIIELQHVFQTDKSLYLAFEYCDSDLKQYMRCVGNKLSPAAVESYCWQLINGVTWCHSHRILHRDLKPQHLLVQPARGLLKIGDFGLARAFSLSQRAYTHEVVTLWYRAPEILLGANEYACPVDMWSVGCVLGEIATGKPMFPGDSEIDQLFKIFQCAHCRLSASLLAAACSWLRKRSLQSPQAPQDACTMYPRRLLGTPADDAWEGVSSLPDWQSRFPYWRKTSMRSKYTALSDDGVDLLEELLTYDPQKRIVGKDALEHVYFDSLDREAIGKGPLPPYSAVSIGRVAPGTPMTRKDGTRHRRTVHQ